MRVKNLAGIKFGKLNVINRVPNIGKKVVWRCFCDCGQECIVKSDSLLSGKTKSCGCLKNPKGVDHPRWKGGRGHHGNGYIRRHIENGRILEHRLIIETAIGKPIPKRAVTHHFSEIKDDNGNPNLVLCENRAYHNFLHKRQRALRECGHSNWLKCCYCKKYDSIENLYFTGSRSNPKHTRHALCHKRYMVEYHGFKRLPATSR